MYFGNFPTIIYDSVGDGNLKIVTNLLKRVAVRAKVKTNTFLFDTYDVAEGETPEMIAHKLYGDSNLHWVILYINNVTDRYHQWPMSAGQFLSFLKTPLFVRSIIKCLTFLFLIFLRISFGKDVSPNIKPIIIRSMVHK